MLLRSWVESSVYQQVEATAKDQGWVAAATALLPLSHILLFLGCRVHVHAKPYAKPLNPSSFSLFIEV